MGDVVIKVETYTGTLESAELLLKNLRIEDDFYHFDITTKRIILIKFRLILRPGDSYQYRISKEDCEAID